MLFLIETCLYFRSLPTIQFFLFKKSTRIITNNKHYSIDPSFVRMNKIFTLTLLVLTLLSNAQSLNLDTLLMYPRLDSTNWRNDMNTLNSVYSMVANRYQTCVSENNDSSYHKFCFNTSLGHVKMDSSLFNFKEESLIGKWKVIKYGKIEVKDRIIPDSATYGRSLDILQEQDGNLGFISFTDKRINTHLINLDEIPKRKKKYKILEGRHLAIKSGFSYSGASYIGLTKDEKLILDDLTYRTDILYQNHIDYTTTIRRLILTKVLE